MVDTRTVKDITARKGADGTVGRFVFFAAEMTDALAGPHFFEVVVL